MLGKGSYAGTKIQNCSKHLRKHSDCLCKFSEGSQAFLTMSDAIQEILMEIRHLNLHQKKLAGIHLAFTKLLCLSNLSLLIQVVLQCAQYWRPWMITMLIVLLLCPVLRWDNMEVRLG